MDPKVADVVAKAAAAGAVTDATAGAVLRVGGPVGAMVGGLLGALVDIFDYHLVPSSPIGLKACNITTTSIPISWQLPHDPNGIIRGYQISYTPGHMVKVNVFMMSLGTLPVLS